MAEEGYKVLLNVYDLSQGLARQLSHTFLGKVIEGIWHTGIVVYGTEYFFGGGIQHLPVGTTPYGRPIKVVDLGVTHVPRDDFELFLQQISPRYTAETYNLLTHNCNNFSNEVAQFLVGSDIPEYILQLPNEVMNSPMGAVILPMIQNLETTLKAGAVPQVPQFRPPTMSQPIQSSSGVVNSQASGKIEGKKAEEMSKEPNMPETVVPTAVKPAEALEGSPNGTVPGDPLGDARSKVQEEITQEFAAMMASGTLRASEAAALATRKVMQKYGHLDVPQQS